MTDETGGLNADEILGDRDRHLLPYRDRANEQKLTRRTEEHELRKKVAKYAYIAVAAQIAVADVVFILYACVGRGWNLPSAAIGAWLAATVVQSIAVTLVITRYLFPPRRRG
jgi:hypothetical protein